MRLPGDGFFTLGSFCGGRVGEVVGVADGVGVVFAGYLKAEKVPKDPMQQPAYSLSIPNLEARTMYTTTLQRWIKTRMEGHGGDLNRLSG